MIATKERTKQSHSGMLPSQKTSPHGDANTGNQPSHLASDHLEFHQRYLGNHYLQSMTEGEQQAAAPTINQSPVPSIQRMCACGTSCAGCKGQNETGKTIQTKLTIGSVNDVYEQEADRVAEHIMRTPTPSAQVMSHLSDESITIQRISSSDPSTSEVDPDIKLNQHGGQGLSASTRAFMEPRFGADFNPVRVHSDQSAHQTASQLHARAFTYGNHIWLGKGANESDKGLMAHELTHVLQQSAAADIGQISNSVNRIALSPRIQRNPPLTPVSTPRAPPKRIQRRWDAATSECAGQPEEKWIERIVVQQETPQSVTLHWSDGTQESDVISAGKGHCCADPAQPDGVACTELGSTVNGSNCTPITKRNGYLVKHRDLDHNGVLWWTEFVPSRGIALHEYRPVDGTPLSHGCVRLHRDMAVKTFCGARQNRTWVQVQGFARPMCDNTNLRSAWLGDFRTGGRDLSAHDGDADMQRSIREARRMINAAFGRTLTVAEIRALGADDIPRCSQVVSRPSAAADSNDDGGNEGS